MDDEEIHFQERVVVKKFIKWLVAVCFAAVILFSCLLAGQYHNSDLPPEITMEYPLVRSAPMDENMTARTGDVLVKSRRVNVRSGPSADFPVIGAAEKGNRLSVQGEFANGWMKIVCGKRYGYINGRYLDFVNEEHLMPQDDAFALEITSDQKIFESIVSSGINKEDGFCHTSKINFFENADGFGTAARGLNIRADNSVHSAVLAVVPRGAAVRIRGKYPNGWYQVIYNGVSGCVRSAYIRDIQIIPPSRRNMELNVSAQEKTNTPPDVEAYYACGEAKDHLVVWASHTQKDEKVGVVPQGTTVRITGKVQESGWYQIAYGSGFGFINGDYLKDVLEVSQKSFYLNKNNLSVGVSGKKQLWVNDLSHQVTIADIQWSSSNSEVAEVNQKGVVTGIAPGSAQITAKDRTSGKILDCTVTVVEYKPAAHISGVPVYNQVEGGYPTGCEQFSMRMIFNFYGYHASVQDMVDALTVSPAPYLRDGKTYGGDPSLSFIGDPKKKKPEGFGCLPSAIERGMNRYMEKIEGRHKAYDITGCDEEVIYHCISKGIPVLTASGYLPSVNSPVKQPDWTWEIDGGPNKGKSVTWWRSRHVMVVVGYDDDYIYVNDPWFSREKRFNKADWLADWNRVDRHTVVLMEK